MATNPEELELTFQTQVPELDFSGQPQAPEPIELDFADNPAMDTEREPGLRDYVRALPGLVKLAPTPNRMIDTYLLDEEDRVSKAAAVDTVKQYSRSALASMLAAIPGQRPARIAEDVVSESLVRPIASTAELAGTLAEDVGIPNPLDDFGKALADVGIDPLDAFSDREEVFGEEDFGDELSRGIASTLGFVAAGSKAKALNFTKKQIAGVVATLGAAVGAQHGREEAELFNATPEQIRTTYYANALLGTSEAVPVVKAFDRLDKATGGILSRNLKRNSSKTLIAGVAGGLEEGLQEAFQTVGSNMVASDWGTGYDPTRSATANLRSAVEVGGSVGFLMNLLAAGLGVRIRKDKVQEVEAEFAEDLKELTGARSLDELAFDENGVVNVQPLSNEYLSSLRDVSAAEQRMEEAADLGKLVTRTESVDKAVDILDQNLGVDITESVGSRYIPRRQSSIAIRDRAQWGIDPKFLAQIKSDEAGKTVLDKARESDIAMGLTHQAMEANRGIAMHQAAISDVKENIEIAKKDGVSDELIQGYRDSIQNHLDAIKVYKAKIREEQNTSKALRQLTRDIKKIFPEGTRFLINDAMGLAENLEGRVPFMSASGGANVWYITNPKTGKTMHAQGIYLDMEDLVSAAGRLQSARNRKASQSEINSFKEQVKKQRSRVLSTFYHEMGHHMAFTKFGQLSYKISEGRASQEETNLFNALRSDYYRYVIEGLKQSTKGFLGKAFTLPRAADQVEGYARGGALFNNALEDFDQTSPRLESPSHTGMQEKFLGYVLSFDEYLAEEFSKFALNKRFVDPTIAPFFREGVKDMRKMLAQRPGNFRLTSEAMGNYFLNLSAKGRLAAAVKEMQKSKLEPNPLFAAEGEGLVSPEVARRRTEDLDRFNKFMDIGFNILQIAEQNPHIRGLQAYVETMRDWKNEVNGHLREAEITLTDWKRLGKKEQESLGRALLDETVGRTYDGKVLKRPRNFNDAELAKYNLSPEALAIRAKIKQDFKRSLDEMEGVLKNSVRQMFLEDPVKQAAELQKITKEFQQLRGRPYFPLMRFGEYVMQVRANGPQNIDGETYSDGALVDFQAFDSKPERDRAAREIRKGLGGRVSVGESVMVQPNFSLQGMPITMVEHLERTLGSTLSEDQKKMFDQVKKDVLPFKSFRKQFTRRKKVHGYSLDAMRSYANYMTSFANHIGRVKFDKNFQESLKSVDDSRRVMMRRGQNADKRAQILNHMNNHLEYVLNPVNEFTAIRSAAFTYFLGYNVKSAFVNLTQVPLVTYPHLAAKFGDARAVTQLTRANKTAITALRNPEKLGEDLKRLVEQGLAESWLDESLATELALAASEPTLDHMIPRRGAKKLGMKIAHYGSIPFHAAEKFNRHVTAIAAYRLSKAEGNNHEAAVRDARTAVEKSQFEYARWARPRFMRGKVGGTLFVFMNYLQNALYFVMGGDRGAMRMWLMMFLMAGLQGLPFGEDVMDLVDGAMSWAKKNLGMKDPHTDLRTDIRKLIKELNIDPDLFMHGLSSSTFGLHNIGEFMGWPIPEMDLSASLSLGRIVPGAQVLRPQGDRDFERFLAQTTEGVGGAAVSGAMGMAKALWDNHPDQWKRWERAMPAAMRQISKAARYAVRGEEATRGGYPIAELDMQDHQDRLEATLQAMGFTPRSVSKGWEGFIAEQSAVTYYEAWATSLLRDWNYAQENRDEEAKKEANAAIRQYNNQVPYNSMKIGPDKRRQSWESWQANRKFNENRIERNKAFRHLSSEIRKVYEDADSQ